MRRWLSLAVFALAARGYAATGLDVTTDFVSEYVFRGANMHQGTSIQTSFNYNILDTLTASLWSNLRLANSIGLSETDYSLQWTYLTASRASLTAGAVYYDRRISVAHATTEAFGGVDLNLPGSPSLYVFWDFDRNPGVYYQLSAAHHILLPDYRGTVDVTGALGFDTGRINGFADARLSVGVSRHLGDWVVAPSVDLHFPAHATDPGAHGFRPVFRFSASRSF